MQNVRANVKVIEFQFLYIFSCILTLLIKLIKLLTTKDYDRRASGDCGTSGSCLHWEMTGHWLHVNLWELSASQDLHVTSVLLFSFTWYQHFYFVTLTLKFDLILKIFNLGCYLVMVAAPRASLSSDNSYYDLPHTVYCFIFSSDDNGGPTDQAPPVVCPLIQVTTFLWFLRGDVVWAGQTRTQMWRYAIVHMYG